MAKRLVICEKPSVARAVAIGLGVKSKSGTWENGEWIIAAASGHLLEALEPDQLDPSLTVWRIEDLPILPKRLKFQPAGDRAAKRLGELHNLIGRDDVVGIVNACDAAREGELIFKQILCHAPVGTTKPVWRAWFSSLTYGAIRHAFANLQIRRASCKERV